MLRYQELSRFKGLSHPLTVLATETSIVLAFHGMDGCVILVSEFVISVVSKISRIELVTIPGFVKIPGAITSPHVISCGNVTFPGTNGMDGYLIVVSAVVISVFLTISRIELVTIPGIVLILGLSYPLTLLVTETSLFLAHMVLMVA